MTTDIEKRLDNREDDINKLLKERQDEAKRIIDEWSHISPEQEAKTAKTIAEVEAKIKKYFDGVYEVKPTIQERVDEAKRAIEDA